MAMNREQVLLQVRMILESVCVLDSARDARNQCLQALRHGGWDCGTEVPVASRGDYRRGRVDIEARKRGWSVGIEIDRKTPRYKSVVKLSQRSDWLKVIATRGPASRLLPGVDLYVPLRLQVESILPQPQRPTRKRRSVERFRAGQDELGETFHV